MIIGTYMHYVQTICVRVPCTYRGGCGGHLDWQGGTTICQSGPEKGTQYHG